MRILIEAVASKFVKILIQLSLSLEQLIEEGPRIKLNLKRKKMEKMISMKIMKRQSCLMERRSLYRST